MVQAKYFGDSRDFFKYDLITSLVTEVSSLRNYVFIPMLTPHRKDNQGNEKIRDIGNKRYELKSFIQKCQEKSLRHWETWLSKYVDNYHTVEPVDGTYFYNGYENRRKYWDRFKQWFGLENALIFLDPDTGLEPEKQSYLVKQGTEKYLLNDELKDLVNALAPTSALMIYQHLVPNKKLHIEWVNKKLEQARISGSGVFVCAYREDDLAFIFLFKEEDIYEETYSLLNKYHSESTQKFKSIHPTLKKR